MGPLFSGLIVWSIKCQKMQENSDHNSVYYHIRQEKQQFLTSGKLEPASVLFLLEKMKKIYYENSPITFLSTD